jgi:pimeloyl-ACP methyl ester carboxylesterase
MRILILNGVNCTKKIWDYISPYLDRFEVDYVEYPHDITLKAYEVWNITKWVYDNYHGKTYQAVIGHSLGGIIALELASRYKMKFDKIIYLDTNLKPANDFYRNLMTLEHMDQFKDEILPMFQEERKFYTPQLYESIQGDFDYTYLLKKINQKVYAIYGDRNVLEYKDRIIDLNLSDEVLEKLELKFIHNSCHMIMLENPVELHQTITDILNDI